MKQATAKTKYVRVSPRKARLAAALIRKQNALDALTQLQFSQLKAGRLLMKTLHSAIANAEQLLDVRREDLHVLEVRVDEGPTMKRAKSKCRGGRMPILKRTSHFTIVVGEE
ncbi:50S ribosomal protein L22 [Chlamydiales bacterium SCGC AG-110-M15]|nr:50S ribosomal protein L22 [Chlamydiales bacterium SCGC AG-110-M15]